MLVFAGRWTEKKGIDTLIAALSRLNEELDGWTIRLIGDGDRGPFTTEQVRYLAMVVDALLQKTGISPDRVYLHDELASTTSPGRYFPRSSFRELLGSL